MKPSDPIDDMDHAEIMLGVLAAVDYLSQTSRPGLTVWDAIEEAIRWWTSEHLDPTDGFPTGTGYDLPWNDPDPLRTTIERLFAVVGSVELPDGHALPEVLGVALEAWSIEMAERHNDGHSFSNVVTGS